MLSPTELTNTVTGMAVIGAGLFPLLYSWLGRPQPLRWLFVYFCVFLTGLPTVWYHGFGETPWLHLSDTGSNILLAWAFQAAVAGDFYERPFRWRLLGTTGLTVILGNLWMAYEAAVSVEYYPFRFGNFGGYTVGELVLIANAFVGLGLLVAAWKWIPKRTRPLLWLVLACFVAGLLLSTASNHQVSLGIVAYHAIWHLVASFGFLTIWVFNDHRFHDTAGAGARASAELR